MCVTQGDEYDSSDEEWDTHIGRHARAFLGLDEPVAEIALDDGVGIGMMVRNAFARADEIHMRASTAKRSSESDPSGSSMHHQSNEDVEPVVGNTSNVHREGGEVASDQQRPMFRSTSDTDMQSTYPSSLGSSQSDSSNSLNHRAYGRGDGNVNGESSAEEGFCGMPDNEDQLDDSSSTASGGGGMHPMTLQVTARIWKTCWVKSPVIAWDQTPTLT